MKCQLSLTLQEEAEHVEQEEDARAIQICEESFIVDDWQLMSGDIADYIRYADDNEKDGVH